MALVPTLGLELGIGNYALDFLLQAEEVVVCNSVIGAWQVKACEDKTWKPGVLTPKLRNWLNSEEC